MRQLSPTGQQAIDDIARRHGISTDAALSMLDAVVRGNGSMAQFSHPEFGGSGQWMRGGMTMVSDMFNNQLKSRVDGLCFELSNLVASQPDLLRSGSFQSQSQNGQEQFSGGGYSYTSGNSQGNNASLFVPPPPDWWGPTLRWPDSTGSQNGARYANFAQARRLAIEANGVVTIYDTLDHQIGGFSQQQSYGGSLSFNSQYGLIDVASLPVISVNGVEPMAPAAPHQPPPAPFQAPAMGQPAGGNTQDIFAMIERLADLRAKGVLDDAEFQAKKSELLGRL
ncbi:SHOCT domain-containing protein [Pseudorhodoferax sp.]|uniref:SHOCT domain-containing protein n=1 Tax=Pseudorhodoferax sp. TaxID=1993553 RepID=UPI002DD67DB2|nr:SHOCT domain-containing protein [Pseudorhodoferax sp.]